MQRPLLWKNKEKQQLTQFSISLSFHNLFFQKILKNISFRSMRTATAVPVILHSYSIP